jgi:haloacetate dehalogenase
VTFFPGFERRVIATSGADIHTVSGGSGPPLLLLHGSPQTHVMWHKVAPRLAESFTVVLTDLRGYGDSSKPAGGGTHADYSKRAMANDQVQVMRALGFDRFRGGRPRSRRARHLASGGGAPRRRHARRGARHRAACRTRCCRTASPPSTSIGTSSSSRRRCPKRSSARSAEFWVRGRCRDRDGVTPEALAEYVRCYTPDAIHGNCEDYRAGATIDLEHAGADGDRLVECPLLVLWGRESTVGRLYDVMDIWRRHGRDVRGLALPGRHFIAEECPDATFEAAAGVLFCRVVRYTLRATFFERVPCVSLRSTASE